MKKLERSGQKIIIRPYKKTDYLAWKSGFLSILPNPRNRWDITPPRAKKYLSQSTFLKILTTQKRNRHKDYFFDFGVFLKDGTLVGGVSIMDISRQVFQNAYLGYRIFNNQWGNGYGKEAVVLAIDIAFKDLKLHRLEAGIEPANKRSIRLVQSVGMKREGYSPRRLYLRGQWQDMVLFVARSEDYKIKWKPLKQKKMFRF